MTDNHRKRVSLSLSNRLHVYSDDYSNDLLAGTSFSMHKFSKEVDPDASNFAKGCRRRSNCVSCTNFHIVISVCSYFSPYIMSNDFVCLFAIM